MSHDHLRRLICTLFAVAFFSASTLQTLSAVAMPVGADMMASMAMNAPDGAPDEAPMPCKGMIPACMVDLGCVFMIGVPVPASRVAVRLVWLRVSYQSAANTGADGSIRSPDLRPPIRLI